MPNTNHFEQIYENIHAEFIKTQAWTDMLNTREDSPWHREDNVGVHTRMLLEWYARNLRRERTDFMRMVTKTACLFHDVGKPAAEITKWKEERGTYRAYPGHEFLSAAIWIDFAHKHNVEMENSVIAAIALMIEYHLPFDLKDPIKRKGLKNTLNLIEHGDAMFIDLIMCDQHGRIADEQDAKIMKMEEWISEWRKV